jgi:hypothetical protein
VDSTLAFRADLMDSALFLAFYTPTSLNNENKLFDVPVGFKTHDVCM